MTGPVVSKYESMPPAVKRELKALFMERAASQFELCLALAHSQLLLVDKGVAVGAFDLTKTKDVERARLWGRGAEAETWLDPTDIMDAFGE